MKFLFRNTDNVFMLKDKKCVYKNQHKVDVLHKSEKEYEIFENMLKYYEYIWKGRVNNERVT